MREVTRPSLLCLGLALLILFIEIFFIGRLLAPSRAALSAEKDLLANETDNYTHSAYSALRSSSSDAELKVFLVGGSAMRDSLHDDDRMSATLSRVIGRKVLFANLATFDQTLIESLLLTANLPLGPQSLVLLGVNPRRLSFGPESAAAYAKGGTRLPFIVEAVSAELKEAAGVNYPAYLPRLVRERSYVQRYLEGHFRFPFFSRLKKYFQNERKFPKFKDFFRFRRVRFYLPHPFPDSPLPRAKKMKMAYRIRAENLGRYREYNGYSFSILEYLASYVQTRGARLVLVQSPRSPISYQAYNPVYEDYARKLEAFRSQRNLLYMKFPGPDIFGDEYFYDLDHFTSKGRRKYVPGFISDLKGYLGKFFQTEGVHS